MYQAWIGGGPVLLTHRRNPRGSEPMYCVSRHLFEAAAGDRQVIGGMGSAEVLSFGRASSILLRR